ncbi:nuclear transport factor 2 family protein [Aliiglaciecola sp. 2_MG-2023]|uniref:nuclear transport factor 2 family protein n=1 Tax=unclassified Aliiglaciecola TaxID=2593648 RepID=UPI0026E2C24D|nr:MULTISPECIES: nuclear transport factor 2 family protein [unclassified Aliiglaciecola]MDO6711565.1 nuclear transport factor 2 family protein [Aliiglaciecola sp. 2_MG-2023]MDO6752636.1 nuclear transport factor 2 family protein [Aliiglaciecola sp. 1_MG-2023]
MMKRFAAIVMIAFWSFSSVSFAGPQPSAITDNTESINKLMDSLHYSASQADLNAYLGAFTQNGVFMGTDDWERWSRPTTLDAYVKERFKGGTGWTYKSVERHINFADSGNTAWFDEIIVSPKWGRFRGTGVVIKQADTWKIAHYSMSVLVANEAFFEIAEINKKAFAQRKNK